LVSVLKHTVMTSAKDSVLNNPFILSNIFRHLKAPEIKNASLVRRNWKKALDDSTFWSWATIRLKRDDPPEKFESRRLKLVSSVEICHLNSEQVTSLLYGLIEAQDLGVTHLDASNKNRISRVPSSTFSMGLVRVEHVDLRGLYLKSIQLEHICRSIVDSEAMALKTLYFGDDLYGSEVDSDLVATAIMKLEKIEINLEESSQKVLFSKLCHTEEFKLRNLTLKGELACSQVAPDILSRAIVKLEDFLFYRWDDPDYTPDTIFNEIVNCGHLKLKKLVFDDIIRLPHLSQDILAEAVVKLEEFGFVLNINQPELPALLVKILEKICQVEELTLKKITFYITTFTDLYFYLVPPAVLAESFMRLEKIVVSRAGLGLTSEQVTALLTKIRESDDITLKTLDFLRLSYKDLDGDQVVAPELLSEVIRVESCDLSGSTAQQVREVFSTLADSQDVKLKTLDTRGIDLSLVPAEHFVQGMEKLEKINLQFSRLTLDQLNAILEKFVTEKEFRDKVGTELPVFTFSESLELVSPELFARAFIAFPAVTLQGLTSEQSTAVLRMIAKLDRSDISELKLLHSNYKEIAPELLCDAVFNVKTVVIYSDLSTDQSHDLFNRIASTEIETIELRKLSTFWSNLSSLSPNILSVVMKKLKLDIEICPEMNWRTDDEEDLFRELVKHGLPKLRSFRTEDTRLWSICPEVLSQVVVNAQTSELKRTDLTKVQVKFILSKIIETEDLTLRELIVDQNIVDDFLISPEIWAQAEEKLDCLRVIE